MNVSIVIPARDAADTLPVTLESLLAQTHGGWEAIVVDDGSVDGTGSVARAFAARDARILVDRQPGSGASAARNAGLRLARGDCVVFLDADDWIAPRHLERLVGVLVGDGGVDAVVCGSTYVAADGTTIHTERPPGSRDLFPILAERAPFPINACLIRRTVLDRAGGFDPDLRTCEEWDLWQRVARSGARFGAVDDVLAHYRMRFGSACSAAEQLLADGLMVIERGHGMDPRVPEPSASYARGAAKGRLATRRYVFLCWCAGHLLGEGRDGRPLFAGREWDVAPELDPAEVAWHLFLSATMSATRSGVPLDALWPMFETPLSEFLTVLEAKSGAPALARPAVARIERLVAERWQRVRPVTVGRTLAVRIEATDPIRDVRVKVRVDRLLASVDLAGEPLGVVTLPVCDGGVAGHVLADAIAASFAWAILRALFERTAYRAVRAASEGGRIVYRRCGVRLGEAAAEGGGEATGPLHERVFWPVFLQELWGRPAWPRERFYDPGAADEPAQWRRADSDIIRVEVAEPLPDLVTTTAGLDILVTVGGVAVGVVPVAAEDDRVSAQALRAAITTRAGYELCRAAVREGVLGRPLDATPLRRRLAEAAAAAAGEAEWLNAAGSSRALGHASPADEPGVVLAHRPGGAMGTSASRRAALPAAAAAEMLTAAAVLGEPVAAVPPPGSPPRFVLYAPDVVTVPPPRPSANGSSARREAADGTRRAGARVGREWFEALFAGAEDPWSYTSPYERTKYERTLELLPAAPVARALELACAEGHFTLELARRVRRLVAADISRIALERARLRCAGTENVEFVHLDLAADPLPGGFDLIVASEVLYFLDGRDALRTLARRFVAALEPGGHLLTAHAHVVADEPERTGFDWDVPFGAVGIGDVLASTPGLRLVREIRTPLYRVQLYRRDVATRTGATAEPEIRVLADAEPLPHEAAAARIRWDGGPVRREDAKPVVSERVPILAYHRIAPEGPRALSRYRITPEAFEEQLGYFRDAGYRSIGFDEWRRAKEAYAPLPGRPIIFTFDDGYLDFQLYAWPLLRRYGFTAVVFVVADAIGRANAWDRKHGEDAPLLDWAALRRLHDDGVEFGSHSASHRPLTILDHADVVREAARSRAILSRGLGHAVSAFAYPYGQVDEVVQHLVGGVGYTFGVTTRCATSGYDDPLLALPRIEVQGTDSLADLVTRIGVA